MPMIMMAGVFTVVLTREDLWHCARRFEAFFTTRTMKLFSIMCPGRPSPITCMRPQMVGMQGMPTFEPCNNGMIPLSLRGVRFPWKRFCFLVIVFIYPRNMGRKHIALGTCSKAVLCARSQEPRGGQPVQGPCHSIERYLPRNGSP